ncbi:hypothetical protein BRADI_5g13029v3 [Brachypodium distachyon]|uniref:Uncharacterized protein n=1 Tax=Brachypodium distachyon TaxID=15368 RepID=A0A2K2CGW9_BRADI|nr:hypothetical protein BRADI_5g13029v3 [Brachypodium distachyon]
MDARSHRTAARPGAPRLAPRAGRPAGLPRSPSPASARPRPIPAGTDVRVPARPVDRRSSFCRTPFRRLSAAQTRIRSHCGRSPWAPPRHRRPRCRLAGCWAPPPDVSLVRPPPVAAAAHEQGQACRRGHIQLQPARRRRRAGALQSRRATPPPSRRRILPVQIHSGFCSSQTTSGFRSSQFILSSLPFFSFLPFLISQRILARNSDVNRTRWHCIGVINWFVVLGNW